MILKKIKKFVSHNYLIILITILAIFLRLYNFRSTLIFLGDQGRDALVVFNLLKNGDPILIGPTTSVGKIQLGPFFYYFMAPFLLLSSFDPIGPALAVALLGIISVPIFYLILKKIFNPTLAFFSSALFSTSYVIIQNTRTSWNPNPMPLVMILLFYSLYQFYCQKKYYCFLLVSLLFSVALQLHYMVILFAPVLFISFILSLFQNKKDIPKILKSGFAALLIFIIFLLPILIFDLRHNFINYQGLLEFFQKGHHTQTSIIQMVKNTEGRMNFIIGHTLGLDYLWKIRDFISYFLVFFFLLIFAKNYKNKKYQLIFFYLLFSLLGLSLYEGDIYEHYVAFTFPLTFILFSLPLSFLYTKKNKSLKILSSIILFAFIYQNLSRYPFLKPLGWQVDDVKKLSQTIASDIGSQKFNLVLIDGSKDYRAMNYRYFLKIENTQVQPYDQYSSVNTLYLISNQQFPDNQNLLIWEVQSFLKDGNNFHYNLQSGQEFESLSSIITKQWYFPGGPWLYRIDKKTI